MGHDPENEGFWVPMVDTQGTLSSFFTLYLVLRLFAPGR